MEKENIPGGWNLSCGQVFNLEHLISCSRYKNLAGILVEVSQSEEITVIGYISLSLINMKVCTRQHLLLQLISD